MMKLGRRISASRVMEEKVLLFQGISVLMQRFNVLLLDDTFESADYTWANGHSGGPASFYFPY